MLREGILILGLILLGVAVALWTGLVSLPATSPPLAEGEISFTQTEERNVLWVDSRSRYAFEQHRLPGAVHLNGDRWEEGLTDLMEAWLPDPRPVVVYCASEDCGTSRQVASRLREAVPDMEIYSLHGGWNGPKP